MIQTYNRKELILGIACCAAGAAGYGCAYLFFRHVPGFVLWRCGVTVPASWLAVSSVAILMIISLSGLRLWKRAGGFFSYQDSGLYHELDLSSGGANVADLYGHRITAPAYLLGQLFLAGPLMTLRGIRHIQNRINPDKALDESLEHTLALLRKQNKWQSLSDHAGLESNIILLAKMGKIDFSNARGPRFRAYPPDFHDKPSTQD